MEIRTTRFGTIQAEPGDLIFFPTGMLGLSDCLQWVLLADSHSDAFGWLQSTERAEIALAVVSPRRFAPDYEVRIPRGELQRLALDSLQSAHVLAVVSKNEETITLNLKAPLIINLARRLGRQVINNADQPIQFEIVREPAARRRIA